MRICRDKPNLVKIGQNIRNIKLISNYFSLFPMTFNHRNNPIFSEMVLGYG